VDEAVLTLLGAIVGAAAAVIGQLVAPVIQSRAAHQQWVRDKRVASCEELFWVLRSANRFSEGRPEEFPRATVKEVPEWLQELDDRYKHAVDVMQLYGSQRLRETASSSYTDFHRFMGDQPDVSRRCRPAQQTDGR